MWVVSLCLCICFVRKWSTRGLHSCCCSRENESMDCFISMFSSAKNFSSIWYRSRFRKLWDRPQGKQVLYLCAMFLFILPFLRGVSVFREAFTSTFWSERDECMIVFAAYLACSSVEKSLSVVWLVPLVVVQAVAAMQQTATSPTIKERQNEQ